MNFKGKRIYLACGATDMRNQIDGLAAVVPRKPNLLSNSAILTSFAAFSLVSTVMVLSFAARERSILPNSISNKLISFYHLLAAARAFVLFRARTFVVRDGLAAVPLNTPYLRRYSAISF